MKIISWNVNGIQSRLDAINQLVEKYQPELMCFSEGTEERSLSYADSRLHGLARNYGGRSIRRSEHIYSAWSSL